MNAAHRQEFCVRWNSHLGSIGAAFPQLLAGQRFVDVTLACEGHQVHCHRLVLAACSSYFESILAENPCKHPVIILPSEIKLWEIQALVDFMYKGEVNVTQAGLPQLLRCAEQLRIRGLYGSDAALNLNQLKALTTKAVAASTNAGAGGGGGGGGGGGVTNDNAETDDTTTNSTSATSSTTTVGSVLLHPENAQQHSSVPSVQLAIKKEPQPQQHQRQQQKHQTNGNSLQQQQQQQQQNHQQNVGASTAATTAASGNAPADYESADDYTSPSVFEQYDQMQLDSTIEDDHNYVAAHEDDDSLSAGGADTEHETSANSSAQMHALDVSASYKRVRRSEASLAQAAKCVSKGQTFQTVSNMFNIPVSTIRFYMARKGILPKRKRGRGAATVNSGAASTTATLSSAVMSQALAQMKIEQEPYHLGYKVNEQSTANII